MKTKYLFYSLAIASAFAACSQDELIDAPAVENNLAERPVAGVVEFTLGEEGVDSRFNYEKQNGFEAGDVFGLYLMDNYVGNYNGFNNTYCPNEHPNANDPYWKYQNHWWSMYALTNNIQSNYPFTAVAENGGLAWKNDAKLVEGNYFAMFPQNDLALNRRELWRVIDAEVELKAHSTKDAIFHNVENQFWLGYEQIYRDATASAEGVLKMNVKMSNVLVPLRFKLNNNSNNSVILDKISFVNKLGRPLPTLAYVEPAILSEENRNEGFFQPEWIKTTEAYDEYECTTPYAWDLYDAAKTWTRATIQEIVRWSVPGAEFGRIPYGLTGELARPAYEYSFTYPKDAAVLPGGEDGGYVLTTYLVVPGMEEAPEWEDLMVRIYGWYKDNSSVTGWTYGMLTPAMKDGNTADDNFTFNLYTALTADKEQAEEAGYYRNVDVKFQEFGWKSIDKAMEVASTDEMEKKVLAHLSQVADGATARIKIAPDAAGVEITQEFIKALRQDSKDNAHVIELEFNGDRGGKVIFNEDNTLAILKETTESTVGEDDKLKFRYTRGISLENNAVQTIPAGYTVESAIIRNTSTGKLIVEGTIGENKENESVLGSVINEGEMIVTGTINFNVSNDYMLTLKKGANLTTMLLNNADATTNVEATNGVATVNELYNMGEYECNTCVGAILNVVSGKLSVNELQNGSEAEVAATLEVAKGAVLTINTILTNYSDIDKSVEKVVFNNNGTINGDGEIKNFGTINNYGNINCNTVVNEGGIINQNGANVDNGILCALQNNGVVNAYNGLISDIENNRGLNVTTCETVGCVNIYSETVDIKNTSESKGLYIFHGVAAQHVGVNVNSNDLRAFRTIENMDSSVLFEKMAKTATKYLFIGHNLNLDVKDLTVPGNKFNTSVASEITLIQVEGAKVNFSGKINEEYTFRNAQLDVLKNKQLHIEDLIKIKVKGTKKPFSGGTIHVASNSTLTDMKGNNIVNEHTDY